MGIPAYQAVAEAGRAQPPAIRAAGLQREINDGHKAVESWDAPTRSSSSARAATSPPTAATSRNYPCYACASRPARSRSFAAGDTTLPDERAGASA
jgi:hypothetical protein